MSVPSAVTATLVREGGPPWCQPTAAGGGRKAFRRGCPGHVWGGLGTGGFAQPRPGSRGGGTCANGPWGDSRASRVTETR